MIYQISQKYKKLKLFSNLSKKKILKHKTYYILSFNRSRMDYAANEISYFIGLFICPIK